MLEFVHSEGVIHRDIKPDNLIRRKKDRKIVLIDFGAVKAMQDAALTQDRGNVAVIRSSCAKQWRTDRGNESSPSRKNTTRAMSSGVPMRPPGVRFKNSFFIASISGK